MTTLFGVKNRYICRRNETGKRFFVKTRFDFDKMFASL